MPAWCYPYIAVALFGAFISWQASDFWHDWTRKLAVDKVISDCASAQEKTKEKTNELRKKISTTNAWYADYVSRLLRHEADKGNTPSGNAGKIREGELHQSSTGFLGIAALEQAKAERNMHKLDMCQEWVIEQCR